MQAKIHIKDIKVDVIIGVHKIERREKQPLIIQACIEVDVQEAVNTDNINSAVNYAEVVQEIIDVSEATEFNLLESFAAHLAKKLLKKFKLISIGLIINKPFATKGISDISIECFLKSDRI